MEMGGGTEAIVGSCRPTADFQVLGACSDKGRRQATARQGQQVGTRKPQGLPCGKSLKETQEEEKKETWIIGCKTQEAWF